MIAEIHIGKLCVYLAVRETEAALECVKKITDIAEALYADLCDAVPRESDTFSNMLGFIKDYPEGCWCRIFSEEDNILTREERFKACKARIDAL